MMDILILIIAGLINFLGCIYLVFFSPKKIERERIDLDNLSKKKIIKNISIMGNIGIVVGFGLFILAGIAFLYERLS